MNLLVSIKSYKKSMAILIVCLTVVFLTVAGIFLFFGYFKKYLTEEKITSELQNTPTNLSVPGDPKIESMEGDEAIEYLKKILPKEEMDKILDSSSSLSDISTNSKN
jgi:flagellar basal body-associated protein FliL